MRTRGDRHAGLGRVADQDTVHVDLTPWGRVDEQAARRRGRAAGRARCSRGHARPGYGPNDRVAALGQDRWRKWGELGRLRALRAVPTEGASVWWGSGEYCDYA